MSPSAWPVAVALERFEAVVASIGGPDGLSAQEQVALRGPIDGIRGQIQTGNGIAALGYLRDLRAAVLELSGTLDAAEAVRLADAVDELRRSIKAMRSGGGT